ncbi:MAG: sigma factor-like helix-turn-helix DNA-binding protein [Gemmata sp.]
MFFEGAGRGQYHAPSERDLWALLVTIVLNKQRSQARRAAVLRAPKRNGGPRPRAEDEPGVAFAARDILERLPSPEREIAELRLAGHAVEEIAQRLGRSRRTVERNLQACRKRLLEQVTTHE